MVSVKTSQEVELNSCIAKGHFVYLSILLEQFKCVANMPSPPEIPALYFDEV